MNEPFSDYTITEAESHMVVLYKGMELYNNRYDMCQQALKLDTPYSCPIKKGKIYSN